MGKKQAPWLDAGDHVRVAMMSGKPGPTLYEVVSVDRDSGFCQIREYHPTIKYAAQEYYAGGLLLEPKVTREMIKAFNRPARR